MSKKDKHAKSAPPIAAVETVPETGDGTPAEIQPDSISVEELQDLKARAAKADENWDKFLRAAAELDNYRKRVSREKEELARYTSERVVSALLPVLDNLDRALTAAETHTGDTAALMDGLKQIHAQFRRTLEQFGLQEIVTNPG